MVLKSAGWVNSKFFRENNTVFHARESNIVIGLCFLSFPLMLCLIYFLSRGQLHSTEALSQNSAGYFVGFIQDYIFSSFVYTGISTLPFLAASIYFLGVKRSYLFDSSAGTFHIRSSFLFKSVSSIEGKLSEIDRVEYSLNWPEGISLRPNFGERLLYIAMERDPMILFASKIDAERLKDLGGRNRPMVSIIRNNERLPLPSNMKPTAATAERLAKLIGCQLRIPKEMSKARIKSAGRVPRKIETAEPDQPRFTPGVEEGFSRDYRMFRATDSQWWTGLLILAIFTAPLSYAVYQNELHGRIAHIFWAFSGLLGLMALLTRTVGVFDGNVGSFSVRKYLGIPIKTVEGGLEDIERVILRTYRRTRDGKRLRSYDHELSIMCDGRKTMVSTAKKYANLENARRLAVLAGSVFSLEGNTEYWGWTDGMETPEEAAKALEQS